MRARFAPSNPVRPFGELRAGPEPVEGWCVGATCSWFDKLTTNGVKVPLILSLSKEMSGIGSQARTPAVPMLPATREEAERHA